MRKSLILALGFATLGVLSAPQPLFAASALMNHPAPSIYRANGGVANGGVTNGGTISGGGSANSGGGTTTNGGVINSGGGTTNSGTITVRNGSAIHGGLGGGASATQFKAR
jgi:hypothetical protein